MECDADCGVTTTERLIMIRVCMAKSGESGIELE